MSSTVSYRLLHRNYRLLLSSPKIWSQSCNSAAPAFGLQQVGRHSLCTSSTVFQTSDESKQTSSPSQPAATSFATLFRNSPLVQLGPPEGKVVVGSVVDVVGDDLYIDFGFKFNAVCRRPKQNPGHYVRGANVKVRINDLELSDRFLGSTQDMTLLEADVTLLGLISSPVGAPPKSETS